LSMHACLVGAGMVIDAVGWGTGRLAPDWLIVVWMAREGGLASVIATG